MNEHSPIKRDPSIVAFSRDHHYGLQLVWKIRYGIENKISAERISKYILFFFEQELEPHFKEEERHLFPLLRPDNTLRVAAQSDHAVIRDMKEVIKHSNSYMILCEHFATLLEQHIRFEERELFKHIQDTVPKDVLATLALTEGNHEHGEAWKDHFWEKG